MSIVNIKWVTTAGNVWPKYIEVTLSDGRVVRYRPEEDR